MPASETIAVVGEKNVVAQWIAELEIERAAGHHRESAERDRAGRESRCEDAAGVDSDRAANGAGAIERAAAIDHGAAGDRTRDAERAGIDRGQAAVGVRAGERERAGADFGEPAAGTKSQGVDDLDRRRWCSCCDCRW